MKVGCIIQARSSSTRFPLKVLQSLPYDSKSVVLEQVIKRVKQVKSIDQIILATTTNREDAKIAQIGKKQGVAVFRGNEQNVLDRYFIAARKYKLDHIVRITSDCPCIDPAIIEHVIKAHLRKKADFTSNCIQRSYPIGQDVDVATFATLESAHKNATEDFEKEHVFPYVFKSYPQLFKIQVVTAPPKYAHSELRFTLDTKEDYILLSAIFDELYKINKYFTLDEILTLVKRKPWLQLITAKIVQKKLPTSPIEQLLEAKRLLHLQELPVAEQVIQKYLVDN